MKLEYYIDEKVSSDDVKAFLIKYNFEPIDFPDVPALKQQYATRFVHAVKQFNKDNIYALICGVKYENHMDFNVLIPIEMSLDIYKLLCKEYFYRYYQMNRNPDRLTWRYNSKIQRNPSTDSVIMAINDVSKLNEVLRN